MKMVSIKDSNVIKNKRNKNHCACQTAFPAGISVWPQLSAIGSMCLNTSSHKGLTICMAGGEGSVVPTVPGLPYGFCYYVWSPQLCYTGVSRGLEASLRTRPNCSPALWLWLRKGRRQQNDPLANGRKQAPHPAPHPQPGPSENET